MNPSSIYTIPLMRPEIFSDFPVNRVFLIQGKRNILIDSGHAVQWEHLKKALQTISVKPSSISEIYYTNHSADTLGNALRFENAQHFSASPSGATQQLNTLLGLLQDEVRPETLKPLRDFLQIPDLPELNLLTDADTLRFNELEIDVVSVGSRSLFLNDDISFVGEIPMGGLPPLLPDPDALQRIVNRAQNLAEGSIYSTFRDPFQDAPWFFKQTQRFFQAFQQSAKLDGSLASFCEKDLGGKPEDELFWALSLLKFAPFFLKKVSS